MSQLGISTYIASSQFFVELVLGISLKREENTGIQKLREEVKCIYPKMHSLDPGVAFLSFRIVANRDDSFYFWHS